MVLRPASLDEERIELANAAVGRWMPARVKNMSYSHYFNVMCRMMCSGAVCVVRQSACPLWCHLLVRDNCRLVDPKGESFLHEAHLNPQKRALVFLKALA